MQNNQQSRNSLVDYYRNVNDYFFNLGQRIKEARLSPERLIKQISYQDIKSQLGRVIFPGSESFILGIMGLKPRPLGRKSFLILT